MSENYIVINGKRAELTKEQLSQLGIGKKRWRANNQDKYCFVEDSGYIRDTIESYYYCDDFRYDSHNYFRTQEEAEIYARVIETEMLLKKYADEHNIGFGASKWHLVYDNCFVDRQEIKAIKYIDAKATMILPRTIYFSSYEIALFAVKEIGEDRILEYLTYEW